jgi:hypothetical protein
MLEEHRVDKQKYVTQSIASSPGFAYPRLPAWQATPDSRRTFSINAYFITSAYWPRQP